jgi:hypothetical protein
MIRRANHLLYGPPTNGTLLKAIINLKHITGPKSISGRLEATVMCWRVAGGGGGEESGKKSRESKELNPTARILALK